MPLILPGNVGSATAATGFNVANSLRFAGAARDTYLTATFGSAPTLATKNTISLWFKRSTLDTLQQLYAANGNTANIIVNSNNTIAFYTNSGQLLGPRLYRDTSAWMHFVFTFDSTQGTAANRFKVYINGVEETSFNNTAYPAQNEASQLGVNGEAIKIGTRSNHDRIFEGYMAETAFVDGQALDATSFGEFDEDSGIWKPIDVSGLTFGNNGFYLDFEDSGDLGDDESGNGNDFTEVNLAATDQMIDTCTKNFPIQNSIAGTSSSVGANTYTEGNLQVLTPQSENGNNFSTIGVSSGKWYGEFYIKANSGIERSLVGVSGDVMATLLAENNMGSLSGARDVGYMGNDGDKFVSGTESSYGGSAFSVGDVIGVALDLDNRTVNFAQNNSFKGTISIASTGIWHMGCGDVSAGARATIVANYGQDSSFAGSITAANNTDEHSEGLFKYSPPSGFITLNSTNLAEYG